MKESFFSMKKVTFLLIIFLLSVSFVSAKSDFYNNYGISITSEDYQRLLNLGFNDYEINQMDLEEYDKYKDLNGHILFKKTVYFKTVDTYINNNLYSTNVINNSLPLESETYYLSEAEYYKQLEESLKSDESEISPLFATSKVDSYKHMTLYVLSTNKGYQVKNTLVWDKMPAFRSKDLMSIEVDNAVNISKGTREGRQSWTLCNGDDCYSGYQNYDYNSTSWILDSSGGKRKMTLEPNLKNDEWKGIKKYTVKKIDLYIVADLEKVVPSQKIILLNVIGSYQHQILTGYENFEINEEYSINW